MSYYIMIFVLLAAILSDILYTRDIKMLEEKLTQCEAGE